MEPIDSLSPNNVRSDALILTAVALISGLVASLSAALAIIAFL